jgi:hypothetical protein
MKENFHYGTVTEAISSLKKQGFSIDFNLKENCLVCGIDKFEAEDFEIVDVYRYEGNSDPGDESAVYAIESSSGLKGILVTSYGAYSDKVSARVLQKLQHRKD